MSAGDFFAGAGREIEERFACGARSSEWLLCWIEQPLGNQSIQV
jgi:hypothetical protein